MRIVGVVLALISAAAFSEPSLSVIESCIKGQGQRGVTIFEVQTSEIVQEDDYKNGYSAEYVSYAGMEMGFAKSEKGNAILYGGELWPVSGAIVLRGADKVEKPEVRVELASWLMLRERNNKYLCVADNFDGLGRSGSFQAYRYAYILDVKGKGRLYFAVGKS